MAHRQKELGSLGGNTALPPMRFIRLGTADSWAARCFAAGEVHYGTNEAPQALARSGDIAALAAWYVETKGVAQAKATEWARSLVAFLTLPNTTLWVTFHEGRLWWTRAELPAIYRGEAGSPGAWMRRSIGGWSCEDRSGRIIAKDDLSSMLTRVTGYQGTLCTIHAADYLWRVLQGTPDPLLDRAAEVQATMTSVMGEMLRRLHQDDLETLADLLLGRSGWSRVSVLGGNAKGRDLVVEQAVTGERAMVEVKSRATQKVFDDYVARFDADDRLNRLFFVTHSPLGTLSAKARKDVVLLAGETLAKAAVAAGLFDWVMRRIT
jgi:hypothetical protein